MEIYTKWHANKLCYLIVPQNPINQPPYLYIYIRLGISALDINVRDLNLPPGSDHHGDGAGNYVHTVIQ